MYELSRYTNPPAALPGPAADVPIVHSLQVEVPTAGFFTRQSGFPFSVFWPPFEGWLAQLVKP